MPLMFEIGTPAPPRIKKFYAGSLRRKNEELEVIDASSDRNSLILNDVT